MLNTSCTDWKWDYPKVQEKSCEQNRHLSLCLGCEGSRTFTPVYTGCAASIRPSVLMCLDGQRWLEIQDLLFGQFSGCFISPRTPLPVAKRDELCYIVMAPSVRLSRIEAMHIFPKGKMSLQSCRSRTHSQFKLIPWLVWKRVSTDGRRQCVVKWSRMLSHCFLSLLPPSVSEDTTSALNSLSWTWFVHTLRAQMHFMPAMSLMATLSVLSCRCWMQMSARCLRDGERVTNDANRSPGAVAFPCTQVHHDTVNNLHCTSYTRCKVCALHTCSAWFRFLRHKGSLRPFQATDATFMYLWSGLC